MYNPQAALLQQLLLEQKLQMQVQQAQVAHLQAQNSLAYGVMNVPQLHGTMPKPIVEPSRSAFGIGLPANAGQTRVGPMPVPMPVYTPPQKRLGSRSPLCEMHGNHEDREAAAPGTPAEEIKALISRERLGRNKISRMEVTESARLEMQLQNINIKKNSSKLRDPDGAETFGTPKRDDMPHTVQTPQTVDRPCSADGKPVYTFEPGTPGGMCVYFLKGFCSLGNKCRYVHDNTDDGRFVKITGMPYFVTTKTVIDFFSPLKLSPENITFISSKEGKPTGSAIVEFQDRKEALMAQAKDRANITEDRYVLLYPSSRLEKNWHQENAAAALRQQKQQQQQCMLMQLQAQAQIQAAQTGRDMLRMQHSPVSVQGLTPSPLLQLGSPASAQKASSGVRAPHGDDETMRSLLSTLNEAEDDGTLAHDPKPEHNTNAPPPLVKMSNNEWLRHLQESILTVSHKEEKQPPSIPALVATPKDEALTALMGLGYNESNCLEIFSALQAVSRKTQLPFMNQSSAPQAAGQGVDDMPSLLPMEL